YEKSQLFELAFFISARSYTDLILTPCAVFIPPIQHDDKWEMLG
ncbi:hypothetical protein VIBRN418_19699, partial [Vibrio sp. N418]